MVLTIIPIVSSFAAFQPAVAYSAGITLTVPSKAVMFDSFCFLARLQLCPEDGLLAGSDVDQENISWNTPVNATNPCNVLTCTFTGFGTNFLSASGPYTLTNASLMVSNGAGNAHGKLEAYVTKAKVGVNVGTQQQGAPILWVPDWNNVLAVSDVISYDTFSISPSATYANFSFNGSNQITIQPNTQYEIASTIVANTTNIALLALGTTGQANESHIMSHGESSILNSQDKGWSVINYETLNFAIFGVPTGRPLGDVNGNCKVDVVDLAIVAARIGSVIGDTRYSASADLNNDGKIDVKDLVIIAISFGQTC